MHEIDVSTPLLRWGIKVLSSQEGRGSGLQWSTLFDRTQPDDPVSMGVIWAMLLADVVFYAAIVAYVDSVWPGRYGVPKKPYFLFQVRGFILVVCNFISICY